MSQLFARSVLVLALLFGLVFAVGAGVLYYYNFPLAYAVGYAVVIVSLEYLIGPLLIDWIFKIRWGQPEEISQEFADFLRDLCKKRRIPVPRFGMIEDGNPNAFTYGHIPADARLVVTRGVQQMLTPDEFNAVVAHEIGHIRHYDFIVMTIASLVPLLLYLLYSWTRGSRRGGAGAVAVAVGAYAAYVISRYIVLFLSRVREYFADEHAAYSVSSANHIATALVKIAYGLARISQDDGNQDDNKKKDPNLNPAHQMGSLGICSFSSASPMALYSTSITGGFSTDLMIRAMQWDLWNPWARFFELQGTHPLIARRVIAASRIAQLRGETPVLPASPGQGTNYWQEFMMDITFLIMPYIGVVFWFLGLFGIGYQLTKADFDITNPFAFLHTANVSPLGLALLMIGAGWMLRLAYSFGGPFKRSQVSDLVGEIAVSHVRAIPVELEGEIIGRGVPGLFWSKDLVMQDGSGFITLIYRQPLSFLEFLFGLLKADHLIGRKGVIRGWYRRGPTPYLELKAAAFQDGTRVNCYWYTFLWCMAVAVTIIGLLAFLIPMAR